MRNWAVLAVAGVALSACATAKVLVPTGGSRADGTVEMSYEFGLFEVPQVNMDTAVVSARERCAAWGYTDSRPFGGERRQCQASDMYGGCSRWTVTVTFQCIGKPEATGAQ
jgi:hypothetical protein